MFLTFFFPKLLGFLFFSDFNISISTNENDTLTVLIDACAVALAKQLPELVADRDALEDALDVPTINRILEICGGIKMDDPNLLAAAVLAGQN